MPREQGDRHLYAMLSFFNFMELEHRRERPLSPGMFLRRLARNGGAAAAIVTISLILGTSGYHWLGDESWIDAFVNACMILGGMGQIGDVKATSGKLFSGIFALYAGMVFLIIAAVMLTPVFHRILHRFHWEADNGRR